MSDRESVGTISGLVDEARRDGVATQLARLAKQKKLGTFGAAIILVMILMAVFADVVSPMILSKTTTNASAGAERRTLARHRSIWSRYPCRIIHGSRTALFIGIVSALLGATTGLILGLASGYFGGAFDLIFMRFVDLFMAFPPLIMVMAIVATFGNEIHFVIFAISFSILPDSTRIIRANALQVRRIPYVDAAISLGFGHTRIILRHMLPNVTASYFDRLHGSRWRRHSGRGRALISRPWRQ